MLSYIVLGRRMEGMTRARYFYELGVVHVALMLSAANHQRQVYRYAQNYSVSGVTNEMLIFPLSEMDWDSYAEHRLNSWDDDPYRTFWNFRNRQLHDDSANRVRPQVFGDPAFELMCGRRTVLFQKEGYRTGGGVKLIHWIKRKPELSAEEFDRRWQGDYAPALLKAVDGKNMIRKYLQNWQLPLARHMSSGTKFSGGDARQYIGCEEIFFDSIEALTRFCHDPEVRQTVLSQAVAISDVPANFSVVMTERVIWDYETPGEMTPKSALFDPNSLESKVYADGTSGYDVPKPPADQPAEQKVVAAKRVGGD